MSSKFRRILLTGSEGLIGTELKSLLVAEGAIVLGIDNLSLGQPAPVVTPSTPFRRVDITDGDTLRDVVTGFEPDAVVHLAAIHHIPTCEERPAEAYATNILGTQRVLDTVRALRVRPALVIASSGAVYDWTEGALDPDRSPVRPRDVYAISKYANEQQLEHAQQAYGGTAVVARIFNTLGPADRNGHLVPNVLAQIRRDGADEVEIRLGNLTPRRDYIFVTDTAAALARMALHSLGEGVHRFNVGSGVEHAVTDVIDTIASAIGRRVRIVSDPSRMRRLDRASQLADISKTRSLLGWAPSIPFHEAIRRTVTGG